MEKYTDSECAKYMKELLEYEYTISKKGKTYVLLKDNCPKYLVDFFYYILDHPLILE